ncbi:acyltransferase family protein [Limosilactobacillus reuteri]|uniref:acyltransferase family protein n=3 Tax=Limosilactobacillus reuteri TaxID=1598 RepID=UPI00128B3BAB|nr:acyltransferase [Limosilactobacillus reuteri]MQB75669.1 acyltransferase [Limosilactobacillus reuteri]
MKNPHGITIQKKAGTRYVPIINLLKGFSIFTIVLMHLVQMTPKMPHIISSLASIGGTGVHVFFLCSGIGLYMSHLNKPLTFIGFIKKRFLKIYIPYAIIVLISACLPWMYTGKDRILAVFSHLFLFKMFFSQYENSFGIQFWFISTIIQLYFLFIPITHIKKQLKNNLLFFLLFLFISIFWWVYCYFIGKSNVRIYNSFCLQYIWEFALGFIIGEYLYNGKKFFINKKWLIIFALFGLFLQAIMAFSSDKLKIFNDIPALIGYSSLALLLLEIKIIRKTCKSFSSYSYEFYLVHILIFITAYHFFIAPTLFLQILFGMIVFTISLITAFIYHKILVNFIYGKIILTSTSNALK